MSSTVPAGNLLRRADALERVVVVLLYVFLLYRFAGAISQNPLNAVYLVTEGIVMLMVLCRRSTDQISISPADWLVAFGGTFASMMLMPGTPIPGFSGLAYFLLYFGLGLSLVAKLQLWRSFGLVAANRGLKTSGLYALVRHPMYLGYFFVQGGMLLINFSVWNVTILGIWSVLQLLRVRAEERVLTLDPVYAAHTRRVRYRLFPYVY